MGYQGMLTAAAALQGETEFEDVDTGVSCSTLPPRKSCLPPRNKQDAIWFCGGRPVLPSPSMKRGAMCMENLRGSSVNDVKLQNRRLVLCTIVERPMISRGEIAEARA